MKTQFVKTQFLKTLIRFFALASFICVASICAFAQTEAPSPSLAKNSRCFEIRTYYAAPGKLEELHARFRNHTNKLFKKHGMQIVGFWGPTDKEKGSENTLVYILAYPSREAREKSWKGFREDPEWQKVYKESEVNGKLAEKIDWMILKATDYSPVK